MTYDFNAVEVVLYQSEEEKRKYQPLDNSLIAKERM